LKRWARWRDGGRGGHVYLVGNKGLWTLFHLKFARHIKAGNGGDGVETEVLVLMEMINS
jgi:GTPase involved in cell partitioning and DNA repair